MEEHIETTISHLGSRVEERMETKMEAAIMENQLEKKRKDDMETTVLCDFLGAYSGMEEKMEAARV